MALVRPCGPNMDALWPQQSNFLEYPILSSVLCLSVLCHKKADSFLRKYIFLKHGHWYFSRRNFITRCLQFPQKRKIQISNNTNNNEEEENGGDDDDDDDSNNEEEENSGDDDDDDNNNKEEENSGDDDDNNNEEDENGGGDDDDDNNNEEEENSSATVWGHKA